MWMGCIHVARRAVLFQRGRSFSQEISMEPILDTESLAKRLTTLASPIASSLLSHGFWTNSTTIHTTNDQVLLREEEIRAMRDQSIALRSQGRFEQSWSERINDEGVSTRFDKQGVFACEPDGRDYYMAPDILLYMSTIISTLPPLLNEHVNSNNANNNNDNDNNSSPTTSSATTLLNLSNQAFNAKLAVTSPGGSTYPLHVDNTLGITGSPQTDDSRKLTCILYLNPDYTQGDGGELRLLLLDNKCLDLTPQGGRMVIFWSDEIPHEVLACKPDCTEEQFDRYALTIWLPDNDPRNIQSPNSKFQSLRVGAFDSGAGKTWC